MVDSRHQSKVWGSLKPYQQPLLVYSTLKTGLCCSLPPWARLHWSKLLVHTLLACDQTNIKIILQELLVLIDAALRHSSRIPPGWMYFSKSERLTGYPPGFKSLSCHKRYSTIFDFSNFDQSCGFLLVFAMAGQKIQVFCRSTDLVWRVGAYQKACNWTLLKHFDCRELVEGPPGADRELLYPCEETWWEQYCCP